MAFLLNTQSNTVHHDPPVCNTDPESQNIRTVERLDALDAGFKKCTVCFNEDD